jgi:4-amino-4-deoxy-L-arabinose transferase-like glycosyltransferase
MFQMIRNNKIIWGSTVILALFLYVMIFQGSRGLWERDESRYTTVAVRMLQTGDFLIPYLNEDTPHLTKPPLTYWAIAGGLKLLGRNEWGARLPNALAFLGTILLVYAIAKRITPDRPWLSPVIYATSLSPFIVSNIVTTDTLLTLWETLAVLGFIGWWQRKDNETGYAAFLNVMWIGFGLCFLTKGPPGLLPLLAILVFILLKDGWKSLLRLFPLTGLALFVVIGLGWYLVVAAMKPGLAVYFVRDEVIGRVMSGMHHRNSQWYKGFIIYIPTLIAGTLPWNFFLLHKVRSITRTLLSLSWWRIKIKSDQWTPFLILWIFLPLTIFFLSKSRLPLYILPLFVPISLITGRLPIFLSDGNNKFAIFTVWIIILIGIKFTGSVFPYNKDDRSLAKSIAGFVQPSPAEVIFVDTNPFWGLSMYLNCEVKGIDFSTYTATSLKIITSENFAKHGNRLLFIVKKNTHANIIDTFNSLGYPVRKVGEDDSWTFIGF